MEKNYPTSPQEGGEGTWKNSLPGGRKTVPIIGKVYKKIASLQLSINYDRIMQTDERWLNMDKEKLPPRRKKGMHLVGGYNQEQELIFKEMAHTIYNDPLLSQSYGNPKWYPPVPPYMPPEGQRLSSQEIRAIQSGSNPRETMPQENFGDAWVFVSNTPITVDKWNLYDVSGFRYISDQIIYTQLQTFRTIQGVTQMRDDSCSRIIERVKWFVTFCCSERGNEILGMYCYKNRQAIEELTGFLADTPVTNEDDKNEAIITLSQVHHQLT